MSLGSQNRVRVLARIPPNVTGMDLWQTVAPFLFRSYLENAKVYVSRSRDAGATWETAVEVAADPASDAAPTLVSDPWDALYCWYHTGTAAKCYQSNDYGASWTLHATHNGLSYPRAAFRADRLFLAAYDGAQLVVRGSDDFGVTLTALFSVSAPAQAPLLRVDRRGVLHLAYEHAGGSLVHRESPDGATWSAETTLWAGGTAAYALGVERAALAYWSAGALNVRLTDETYGTDGGLVTAPGVTLRQAHLGLYYTHRGDLYLFGMDASDQLTVRYSRDNGASWEMPT